MRCDILPEKEVKTNAMRLLEKNKLDYSIHNYECDGFTDGITVAERVGQPVEKVFKTLVTQGKSNNYYVFAIPVSDELDLKKAARSVNEKSIVMIPVKDITTITGYVRGGCSPIGMKKQYRTIVHETALNFDSILFSGGRLGSQIEMNPDIMLKLIRAEYADVV